jgi:hypothetical protein
VRLGAASLLLAAALAGCGGGSGEPPAEVVPPEVAVMDALIAFARAPSDSTFASLPLADSVGLGLGGEIRARRSARELQQPGAWQLDVDLFRGRAGTASAIDLIADEPGRLRVFVGPHPHCVATAVPAPPQVTDLERVVVQPRDPDGCLDWWTVDAFVNPAGKIEAVTLDLWEP